MSPPEDINAILEAGLCNPVRIRVLVVLSKAGEDMTRYALDKMA